MDHSIVRKIGGACAVLYTVSVIIFTALFVGTDDLIDAGTAREFLPIVADQEGTAVTMSVLLVIAPLLIAVAGLGMFHLFRSAGSLMWVALLGFVGGGLSMVYRGFVWLAMAVDLAPAYAAADEQERVTLAAVGDTLDTFSMGADMVGAALVPGIGVLLFSIAILRSGPTARWVGWLGIAVAVTGGWLTLLVPFAEWVEAITFLGFFGFWIWMVAVGWSAWRTPASDEVRASMSPDGRAAAIPS